VTVLTGTNLHKLFNNLRLFYADFNCEVSALLRWT